MAAAAGFIKVRRPAVSVIMMPSDIELTTSALKAASARVSRKRRAFWMARPI